MKSKIFVFIIIGIIGGLAIYGYFNAVSPFQNQREGRPKIEVIPKSYDFGEIKYGKIVRHSFKIRNLGNEVLEIKKLATSCACTEAKIVKDRIFPGEEAELKVIYDTGAMTGLHAKGTQERIIYIKTNDPISPQTEVMIYAYVK